MTGELFAPIFASDEILAATGDAAWLQAILGAESALAGALGDCGLIPGGDADTIADACRADYFDIAALGRAARSSANPVIPLVETLRAAVPGRLAAQVHRGATSQDILDSATVLVARRAGARIDVDLARLADSCATLARAHRGTLMVGRTLLQHALPVTFGLKAAGWMIGVDDARTQLAIALAGLTAQLGGPVGTLASLGAQGPAVGGAFARRLGLPEPVLPWHTARQRITAAAGALGTVVGTAAKISGDVALLMQTEVAEAAEPEPGGSSAMPHKRNPASAAAVIASARRAHALLPVLFAALLADHERPAGAWHAEWEPWGELLALAGGAVARTAEVITGLQIDPAAMAANLAWSGGTLLSERVVVAATDAGTDHRRVVDAVTRAAGRARAAPGGVFATELSAEPVIAAALDLDEIESLLDPAGYLGATDLWIDRALAAHEARTP
ncbi:MAG: adenylosuccinate lyase family protein [Actinomycetota bacterium]|nr:adenylosuccinate lyase family protein [Actinomycetota bacterium]